MSKDIFYGKCVLSIRFKNHGEYLKWQKYTGSEFSRQWDFAVSYPTVFRATYYFHTTDEVEMMAKKIVQLMQMGFNVYSANWQLQQYESQLEE